MKRNYKVILGALILSASINTTAFATNQPTRLAERDAQAQNGQVVKVLTKAEDSNSLFFPYVKNNEWVKPINPPKTIKEFENYMLYLAGSGKLSDEIHYPDLNFEEMKNLVGTVAKIAHENIFNTHTEHLTYTTGVQYAMTRSGGKTNLKISLIDNSKDGMSAIEKKDKAFKKTEEVVKGLLKDGKIKEGMTDEQKAKVIFEWVTKNTVYDKTLNHEQNTGYGQMFGGVTMCNGYTASFNLMAKMLGLDVYGVAGVASNGVVNGPHIWTAIVIDGKTSYIDTTWGDTERPELDYRYFMATEEFMKKTHSWEPMVR